MSSSTWFSLAAAVSALLLPAPAKAETLVYIHGWNPVFTTTDFTDCQNQRYCAYWGDTNSLYSEPGVTDIRHVGWDTYFDDWRNFPVRQARDLLDARCVGDSCTIICHSVGCPIAGKTLDQYGEGGSRWKINRVLTLGSAEGGTELANTNFIVDTMLALLVGGPTAVFVNTGTVRRAYDHNDTAGAPFLHVAGYDGGWFGTALALPGQDDGVVSFHSACGYVKPFGSTWCSNDWEWVRKTSFGVPYYVQRTVARWANHGRTEYCGRDGCNQHHIGIMHTEFQRLATRANP